MSYFISAMSHTYFLRINYAYSLSTLCHQTQSLEKGRKLARVHRQMDYIHTGKIKLFQIEAIPVTALLTWLPEAGNAPRATTLPPRPLRALGPAKTLMPSSADVQFRLS